MTDWYRKKSWAEEDEKDFFLRLGRARKDGRSQYLKIQAIELIKTQNTKLIDVAESLINKLFNDYPEDMFNKPGSLYALGNIYKLRGDLNKAIEFYKKALDFELISPQVKTQAYLSYSELVIKSKMTEHFTFVESAIQERLPQQLFPIEKYKCYCILAIISDYNRQSDQANQYTDLAEKYANEQTSGLQYHKYLGIVKERDGLLDKLVKRIKST